MTKQIKEESLATIIETAVEVDYYDFRNAADEENYVSAVLAKTPKGRHFRYVAQSGMNSKYAGAMNCDGEWLSAAELDDWEQPFRPG